jgi:hypothetical protein
MLIFIAIDPVELQPSKSRLKRSFCLEPIGPVHLKVIIGNPSLYPFVRFLHNIKPLYLSRIDELEDHIELV